MFQWNNKDGALCGIIVTHVDDFVYCRTLNWHKNGIEELLLKNLLRSARKKRDLSEILD